MAVKVENRVLTEVFRASVDVVAVVRGLGVRRGRVQRRALMSSDGRQPGHERRVILKRRAHYTAVNCN